MMRRQGLSKKLLIHILALFACFMEPCAWAQSTAGASPNYNGAQRLCQKEDLENHVFVMVDFHENPPRRETHWFGHFRYSYLKFFPGSIYETVATNKEATTRQGIEELLSASPGQYVLNKEGVLMLIRNDIITYSYRCIAVLQPRDEFMKGDLVMTGYTRKAKSELYKLYRLWY